MITPPLRQVSLTLALSGAMLTGAAFISFGPDAAAGPVQDRLAAIDGNDFDTSYAALVEAVMPAVVAVRVEREGGEGMPMPGMGNPDLREFFERFFGDPEVPEGPGGNAPRPGPMVGLGSGFIISEDGLVVTNAHVVGDAERVEVRLNDDDRIYDAEVVGVDALTDLALISIDVEEPLPYVNFGDSDGVAVGDKVLAIGNPFGLGGTVTSGIVSAMGRRIGAGPYDDFLQIDAPINRGNSGGPTFDVEGNVVGVNTAIFSPSGGSVGIGFAIAANLASDVVEDLQDDGVVERGWLGVGIQELDDALVRQFGLAEDVEGTVVTQVEPGTPADEAGFQTGDIITALNGEPVSGPNALSRRVAALEPGSEARFTVLRDGDERSFEVTLGQRPQPGGMQVGEAQGEDATEPALGLALAPLPEELREQRGIAEDRGVVVAAVEPNSPAAEANLRRGDVILEIGRAAVGSPQAVQEQLRALREEGNGEVLLLINRNGGQLFTTLPIDVG